MLSMVLIFFLLLEIFVTVNCSFSFTKIESGDQRSINYRIKHGLEDGSKAVHPIKKLPYFGQIKFVSGSFESPRDARKAAGTLLRSGSITDQSLIDELYRPGKLAFYNMCPGGKCSLIWNTGCQGGLCSYNHAGDTGNRWQDHHMNQHGPLQLDIPQTIGRPIINRDYLEPRNLLVDPPLPISQNLIDQYQNLIDHNSHRLPSIKQHLVAPEPQAGTYYWAVPPQELGSGNINSVINSQQQPDAWASNINERITIYKHNITHS